MAFSLIVAGATSMAMGVSFAFVARAVGKASGGHRPARIAHATWWGALAVYLVLQGGFTVAAGSDRFDPGAYLAFRILAIPLLTLSVWGITSFLLYLYTGSKGVFAWAGVLFSAVTVLFYYVTFGLSTSVQVQDWIVTIDDDHTLYRIVYLLVGLPPILAAAAYLALIGKVSRREQRYRIGLVAGAILLYVGSGLATRMGQDDLAIFVSLVILGGLAAATSLLAYYPPPPIRRRIEASPQQRLQRRAEIEQQRQRRLIELI